MEQIISLDHTFFDWINHAWQHPFLDSIMPYWRDKKTWIPAYLILTGILFYKYKIKALYFLVAMAVTIGISDQISSEIIKKTVKRDRPCREVSLDPPATALIHCGGGYSFPSSHAVNHFAVAVFLIVTWGRRWSKWKYLLLLWAASIAIGQVYVGVHYPIDITFGALLGSLIGWNGGYFYGKTDRFKIKEFYDSNKIIA